MSNFRLNGSDASLSNILETTERSIIFPLVGKSTGSSINVLIIGSTNSSGISPRSSSTSFSSANARAAAFAIASNFSVCSKLNNFLFTAMLAAFLNSPGLYERPSSPTAFVNDFSSAKCKYVRNTHFKTNRGFHSNFFGSLTFKLPIRLPHSRSIR